MQAPKQVCYKVWLSCSTVSTRWILRWFVKSRNDWESLDWSGAEHYQYCCQWMEKGSPSLCSHSGPTLQAIILQAVEKWTAKWNVSYDVINVNKMCFYALCYLSNHIALDKKSDISLVVFSLGSAETNVGWGGKLSGHLTSSCVRNIFTKNYPNLIIGFHVTVENVGDVFWRHSVEVNSNKAQWQSFWTKGQYKIKPSYPAVRHSVQMCRLCPYTIEQYVTAGCKYQ